MSRLFVLPALLWTCASFATTTITNSRTEIAFMATLWEANSIQISQLANTQYPQFTTNWQFPFAHSSISSDGDVHIDMGVDSSGTGTTGNNAGESPIIAEVINATPAQLSHLQSFAGQLAPTRGIFRFYTEHASERHFELHPMTELLTNNGNALVVESDYRPNIAFVGDATNHASSTLASVFNGTDTMTATVLPDNTNIMFTYPSPLVNYVVYDGVALSGLLRDSTSLYFWFRPNLVPSATARCRLVTNTPAALAATGLSSNAAITVNALTRTDMLVVSNQIASMSANQSSTFTLPIELITLSLTGVSPAPYLQVSPASNFVASGSIGGPFFPPNQAYTLNNVGAGTLTWSASKTASWLTVSPSSGALAGGATTNLVASINPNANNLPISVYSDTISINNTLNGYGSDSRSVSLVVTGAPLQTIQTVFLIMMENQNWSSIKGSASAPYINNTVLPIASHAEQYYNPPGNHPSLPNYLWLEAGTNFGILNDNPPSANHQSTTNHLVTLLKNAGISWRAYQEDICGCNCPLADTNLYAVRHEPFAFFDDVSGTNNPTSPSCIANIRPYSQLAGDLQSNLVARYNFLTPNLCDDMHNNTGCATTDPIKNGDTWLSTNLPAILNSQAYSNNGAVFIIWDEAGSGDGPIGMIVLSPLARAGGYSNTVHYTHSSTLRTLEEIFGVGPLLGDAANSTDLIDLFNLGAAQLAVSPASGLTSGGSAGGPFTPASQMFSVSNSGTATLNWTATNTANWLTVSPNSGTLLPGSGTTVTASINANATSLSPAIYADTVSFTNVSNGAGNTTRPVSLTVTSTNGQLSVAPVSVWNSSGYPGGPFSPASQNYILTNIGAASLNWTASNAANWLSLSNTAGTLSPGSSAVVTAAINSNANSLGVGPYTDTILFNNTSSGLGNTSRSVNLSVSTTAARQVTIAYLRSLESTSTWQPTDTTNYYGITGVITTFTNTTGGTTASYYIQDATAGINLFVTGNSSFRPAMGDMVSAVGTLSLFDQNLELSINATNANESYAVVGHTNLLPAPLVFGDFTQTNNAGLMETNWEGRLVMLTNVYFASSIPTTIGSSSIDLIVTNSAGMPFDVRLNSSVDQDLRNTIRSRFAWTLTGAMVQFLNSSTYANHVYQLVVTRFGDIVTNRPPPVTASIAISNHNVLLNWPAVPYVTNYATPGAYAYSVYSASSPSGPYAPLATGLTFNTTNGAYIDRNPAPTNAFYKVSSP